MADADHATDALDLVDRFTKGLAAGDLASCRAMFADDGVVWHNYDRIEQPKDETLDALEGFAGTAEYAVIRRYVVPDGCIQQHEVRGKSRSGNDVVLPAIWRVECANGRITRIDEYFDLAQGMQFTQ